MAETPSLWETIAILSPVLFKENCRGMLPPEGALFANVSTPDVGLMLYERMLSELIVVPGCTGDGIR